MPKMLEQYDKDGDGELSKEELEGVGPEVPELADWNVPMLATLPDSLKPVWEALHTASDDDPSTQLYNLSIQVHRSMLQLIAINNSQRNDRVAVMRSLISALESAGEFR
eukprot:TRINITY_DN16395_c0_g1_i7.p1 TRINITY_DN16395_c0_g1~~TRINITY_DN16395_c0_g1_i7.p1  ORF type:complete len:109 (+),score=32.60 TRINITY_DN16395_c0_g1_i7:291-617(+)